MNLSSAARLWQAIDREVWLVTAAHEGRRGGLVATFVSQASICDEAPRVLVGLAHTHATCELVRSSWAFALHLISEVDIELVWRFGLASSRDIDKFSGVATTDGAGGSPILEAAIGWLDCRVESSHETGDRVLFLAEVIDAKPLQGANPLTVSRLIELASPEQKAELRRQRTADSAIDLAAIREWRDKQSVARRPPE